MPSGIEIWIVLAVVILLFGSRLPKIARNLGQAQQEFKKGLSDGKLATPSAETPKPEATKPDTPSV